MFVPIFFSIGRTPLLNFFPFIASVDYSGRERRGNPVVGGGTRLGGMGSTHTAGLTDPRVDSGTHGSTTTGLGIGSTRCGPHCSKKMNELDPRIVGSDRGSCAGLGSTTTHGPTEQTIGRAMDGAGPHQAPILNKVDPHVDSDRNHRASHPTTYSGPAPNTAGPHQSDLVNKLDPRVDSNLDVGGTIGGDKTYSTGTGTTGTTTGGTRQGGIV